MRWSHLLVFVAVLGLLGCQSEGRRQNAEGIHQFELGHYRTAKNHFRQALDSIQDDPDIFYNMARAQHKLEEHDLAEYDYERAVQLEPRHLKGYRGLVALYLETKRTDQAITLLEEWGRLVDDRADPPALLAELYLSLDQVDQALEQARKAVALENDSAFAHAILGDVWLQQGETAQAVTEYQLSLKHNPNQPEIERKLQRHGPKEPAVQR